MEIKPCKLGAGGDGGVETTASAVGTDGDHDQDPKDNNRIVLHSESLISRADDGLFNASTTTIRDGLPTTTTPATYTHDENDEKSSNRAFESNDNLHEYLKVNGLDFNISGSPPLHDTHDNPVQSFENGGGDGGDALVQQKLQHEYEYTLRQWIRCHKTNANHNLIRNISTDNNMNCSDNGYEKNSSDNRNSNHNYPYIHINDVAASNDSGSKNNNTGTTSILSDIHSYDKDDSSNLIVCSSLQQKTVSNEYIQSALVVALKLTECILEAEHDERIGYANPIPLASIAADHVLIRARTKDDRDRIASGKEAENKMEEANDKIIEFVWAMSFIGDNPATGTVMSRLFAVGIVLYELFSTNKPEREEDILASAVNESVSLSSMNLGCDNTSSNHRPLKRSNRGQGHPSNKATSDLISRLELMEVPWSLCSLVKNLLDCQHDPFCCDDTYTSFADLKFDLKLMVDNPSCFLHNTIHHSSSVANLIIDDRLYGRDDEIKKINELYKCCIESDKKVTNGIIISGAVGIGKSTLAKHLQTLTNQSHGYFLSAKFEQHQMSHKPLTTVVNLFDSACDLIFNDSCQAQLIKIEEELTTVLGSNSHLLVILPSLRKLMPSSALLHASSSNCVDSTISTRYMLAELLLIIASYLKPIMLVLDDIQFADHASLLLVSLVLRSTQLSPIFFAMCYRDDKPSMSRSFKTWLTSISILSLESIRLKPIVFEHVNRLISETFHLSPRIVRPLSSVLHKKTLGNPLFLRQLLLSLVEQGYIYVDTIQRRWVWDLEKIMGLEISESVLLLIIEDIQRLSDKMKLGLQIASCIGSQINEFTLQTLSEELGLDLITILQQLADKGFMIGGTGAIKFSFAHDKIQQVAYELISDQQRRENHMRFGLALCSRLITDRIQDEEQFFIAVHQINRGGPDAVQDSNQKSIIAELNLRAAWHSINLSDYHTAFSLLLHGLSFLGLDCWAKDYRLSLNLHDLLTDVAMILHKPATAVMYADKIIEHARCFEDQLNCLHVSVVASAATFNFDKAIGTSFRTLLRLNEGLPCDMRDSKLQVNIRNMVLILQSTDDDTIYKIQEKIDTRMTALMNLYVDLAHILHFFKPWLFGSVSFRMIELTMKTGLSAISPLAFAHFGGLLVTIGYVSLGCRLGKIALQLLERIGSSQYKSKVICFVYDGIFWASEPLQSIVDLHLKGYKIGQQSGDVIYGLKNLLMAATTGYVAGQKLDIVQRNILEFVTNSRRHEMKLFSKLAILLQSQIIALNGELQTSRTSGLDNVPNEIEILADISSAPKVTMYGKVYHLIRAYLFRQLDDVSLQIDISGTVVANHYQLDSTLMTGCFFEGLALFLLARQSKINYNGSESSSKMFIERGYSVLRRMRCWSSHSCWNFESKMLLLEAERMYTLGEHDQASSGYDRAIQLAHDHKFIHEEAIACELAGLFYHERGHHSESHPYFARSVNCYNEWGAHRIVAERVEIFFLNNIVDDILWQHNAGVSVTSAPLGHLHSSLPSSGGVKKRREESIV